MAQLLLMLTFAAASVAYLAASLFYVRVSTTTRTRVGAIVFGIKTVTTFALAALAFDADPAPAAALWAVHAVAIVVRRAMMVRLALDGGAKPVGAARVLAARLAG